jgi:hypothetical protein
MSFKEAMMQYRVFINGQAMHFEDGTEAMDREDVYSIDVSEYQDMDIRSAMDEIEREGIKAAEFSRDGDSFRVERL